MKAVVCRQHGEPDVARLEDVAPPPLLAGTVRIEVHACSAPKSKGPTRWVSPMLLMVADG
jgi:NADPH:quinone reductase-like Zn-dependent oxidoreductase